MAKVCRSKSKPQHLGGHNRKQRADKVEEESVSNGEYTLYPVKDACSRPLQTTVKVDGHDLVMEVDTGASVSLISEATFRKT